MFFILLLCKFNIIFVELNIFQILPDRKTFKIYSPFQIYFIGRGINRFLVIPIGIYFFNQLFFMSNILNSLET
jgi:hypothetical protein